MGHDREPRPDDRKDDTRQRPDPAQTNHPTGEDRAAANTEDEPAG